MYSVCHSFLRRAILIIIYIIFIAIVVIITRNLVSYFLTFLSLFLVSILLFNFSESSLLPHSIPQGLVPDAESYGMIIRSCGHRDLLVEGLKMLEEVTERGMSIKILFIRIPMQCREKSDLEGVIVGKSRGRRGGKVGGREDHFSLNQ